MQTVLLQRAAHPPEHMSRDSAPCATAGLAHRGCAGGLEHSEVLLEGLLNVFWDYHLSHKHAAEPPLDWSWRSSISNDHRQCQPFYRPEDPRLRRRP